MSLFNNIHCSFCSSKYKKFYRNADHFTSKIHHMNIKKIKNAIDKIAENIGFFESAPDIYWSRLRINSQASN